ncbi:hypothetical protein J6590_086763 [Homalodisca vitripennis]|nr:hypothetical protein J6590_086763 [Homalodisca vitripennis]
MASRGYSTEDNMPLYGTNLSLQAVELTTWHRTWVAGCGANYRASDLGIGPAWQAVALTTGHRTWVAGCGANYRASDLRDRLWR